MQNNFCNISTKFVRNDNEQKTDHQVNLQKRIVQKDNLQKNCLKGQFEKKVWKDNLQKMSETMIYKICQQNNPQHQLTKSNPIQVSEDLAKILKVVIHGHP